MKEVNDMPRKEYSSVRLPSALKKKVEKVIEELGYTDPTSFVIDAVREQLRRMGYLK